MTKGQEREIRRGGEKEGRGRKRADGGDEWYN